MAKVTSPLMSGEARGKALGVVYNTWRGISTVKAFKSPANPKTPAQLLARSRMTTQVTAWKALTDVQRANWAVYSAAHLLTDWTGVPKRITGQNWFIRSNVQSIRASGSAISTPPAASAPAGVEGFVLSKATADLKFAWTAPVTAGLMIEVRRYGVHSPGLTARFQQGRYVLMTAANGGAAVVLLAAAPVGYHTAWARSVDPATGLTSQWVSCRFLMS